MSLSNHPNVIKYHVCFLEGSALWLVMPLMSGGSIASVLKSLYPHGIHDEAIIATVLKETLQGLLYFHTHHQIHRDVKGANIMLGSDGRV